MVLLTACIIAVLKSLGLTAGISWKWIIILGLFGDLAFLTAFLIIIGLVVLVCVSFCYIWGKLND